MFNVMIRIVRQASLAVLVSSATAVVSQSSAQASIVVELDYEFSGASDPSGTPPWLRATFTNLGSGVVQLKLENLLETASEFVSGWYFNLDPALAPTSLFFSHVSTLGTVSLPSISKGVDVFGADGDGLYDVLFSFSTSSGRFEGGEELVYNIQYGDPNLGTLDELDFAFESKPRGGNGVYFSAAHVQGIPPGGSNSGWIGAQDYFVPPPPPPGGDPPIVPEPTSVAVWSLIVGLATFLTARQK
jgi:hypothetical protein